MDTLIRRKKIVAGQAPLPWVAGQSVKNFIVVGHGLKVVGQSLHFQKNSSWTDYPPIWTILRRALMAGDGRVPVPTRTGRAGTGQYA